MGVSAPADSIFDWREVGAQVIRIAAALAEQAKFAADAFRAAETGAAVASALLPHMKHTIIAEAAEKICVNVGVAATAATEQLIKCLQSDRWALLAKSDGLSELYYLPIRLSKILDGLERCRSFMLIPPYKINRKVTFQDCSRRCFLFTVGRWLL